MSFSCSIPPSKKNIYPLYPPLIQGLTQYESPNIPPFPLIYVSGQYFSNNSIVTLNGIPCYTIYNGSQVLGFTVSPTFLSNTYTLKVETANPNPPPGEINPSALKSNSVSFQVL